MFRGTRRKRHIRYRKIKRRIIAGFSEIIQARTPWNDIFKVEKIKFNKKIF